MRILNLFRQLHQDYSSIHKEARNFPGSYLNNFFKITMDKTIKTIGYIWHYLFRNKKYDDKLVALGNYKLLTNSISLNSIIYSCGIAEDISFDEAISNKFGCDVFMFDPTKESLNFMNSINNPKLKFFNIGIWKRDGNIKFFYHAKNSNLSATNIFNSEMHFILPCKSIATLMKEYQQTKIDVLKMDIEGASFDILDDLLDKNIYPMQIVVELERPFFIFNSSFKELFSYLIKRRKLHNRLKNIGYDLVELDANELLAIKKN
jgi:FkbM family methyltransferase